LPNFIFCIHNHQPVGNFDDVIEESYQNAYLPFLRAIEKHPSIKLSFHITGCLLDWLLEHHKEYIVMLRKMIQRGQVEMMGGGYYEPILAVIPLQDRIGQIKMMSDRLEELFGKRPRGMWLAERIWEPQLPVYLKEAGIEYVVVDDYHFIKAGLRKEELAGYYITEDMGNTLKIFPGSERLRYIIPFEAVDRFIEHVRWASALGPNPAVIFADDGEKFGTWPGTHQWVYNEGWFDGFLNAITENSDMVKPVTFSEYMDNNDPMGRVYLPTTSYMEMGEWALPAEASETYTNLVNEVKSWPDGERIRRFLQGGFWRNFFAKYPESNWMHKRMLMVSEEVQRNGETGKRGNGDKPSSLLPLSDSPIHHLYQAQCNDAYWHGVFGGLYLPHLRTAVYENLIKAENLVEEVRSQESGVRSNTTNKSQFTVYEKDFDADTFNEIFVRTQSLNLFFSPHNGGSIVELDYRPKAVNLSNTLSRWEEGYHHRVKIQAQKTNQGEAKSIHDLTLSKEEGLEKYLFFDTYQRLSLVEHFLKKQETLDTFRMSTCEELGDFFHGSYEIMDQKEIQGSIRLILNRNGRVKNQKVGVEKSILVKGNEIEVKYLVVNLGQNLLETKFGVEFNLILPCCDGTAGFYEISSVDIKDKDLGSSGEITGIRQMNLVDQWTKMKLNFSFDKKTSAWRFPVETVSLSEAGFEKIFQGSCILFFWDISINKVFETGFKIKVESI
jgi:alpha-amylase